MSKSPKIEIESPSATIWLLNRNIVREDDIPLFVKLLSAGEAQRYARFARSERRRQFLLGRMLVRFAVVGLTGLPAGSIGVVERPGKAPRLIFSSSELPRSHFSISHSRDWVACAASAEAKLGIDIEVIDPSRNTEALSAFAFEQDEQVWLLRRPEDVRQAAFYELWATREALYKLMSDVSRKTELPRLIGADDKIASRGCGWYRYRLPHPKVAIVVASEAPLCAVRRIELNGFTPTHSLDAKPPTRADR